MNKLRTIFTAAMICLVVSIIAVYAFTSWTKTFTWDTPSYSFAVYHEDKVTLWTEDNEYLGVLSQSQHKNLWINNTGNIPVRVQVTGISYENVTATWITIDQTIAVGQNTWFNLTLSDFTGTGGLYTFTFSGSAS
jgi:hypothetical protein